MPAIDVDAENAVIIIVRTEETRPLVISAFGERLAQWVVSQPALLELVIRACRLAGNADEPLDRLACAAGGEPGSDEDWLRAWSALEPAERRRLLREEV